MVADHMNSPIDIFCIFWHWYVAKKNTNRRHYWFSTATVAKRRLRYIISKVHFLSCL